MALTRGKKMMQSTITIMMHSSILARAGGVKMGGFAPQTPHA